MGARDLFEVGICCCVKRMRDVDEKWRFSLIFCGVCVREDAFRCHKKGSACRRKRYDSDAYFRIYIPIYIIHSLAYS